MKPIRVLEAIRQGSVGGGETHVFDLTTRLDKGIFQPVVLSFTEGPMVDNLKKAGIEVHVIQSKIPFDPRVVAQVHQFIQKKEIELVHAHGTRAASNLWLPTKRAGQKLIYTIHGWSFNNSQSKITRLIRTQAEKFLTNQANLNICVSASNLETGKQAIRGFTAMVIKNGINLEKFNLKIDNSLIENELQRKPDEVWLGFIARITTQKDPITLLRGFKIAHENNSKLRLLIVGEGDLSGAVKQEIIALNLTNFVTCLPFRKDIPQILKFIDIYCLPSLWEGLPIGLIEAMAMEKAVIASKVDGTLELVTPETGLLMQPGNATELAKQINKLADDLALRLRLGSQAKKLIQEKFELGLMVRATEQAYLRVLGSARA